MRDIFRKSIRRIFANGLILLSVTVLLHSPLNAQIFIEAENYSAMTGIDTEGTTDEGGGINVGWIDGNDWMEYNVNIPLAGEYILSIRSASLSGGGNLNIASDGSSLANISISTTGGWQAWETIESPGFSLVQGEQKIRLKAVTGGFNLNWFELKITNPADLDKPTTPFIVNPIADVHTISANWNSCHDTTTIVTGYKIYNNDSFFAFSTDTSINLSKLPPETAFDLNIYACDLAGNLSSPASLSIATTVANWELVWFDEFEGTEVDLSKWNYEVGGGGWGNGEAQYYTNGANSSVADGFLSIEARKESYGGSQYTSSRMNNGGKGDFVYGRIEVRAKLPSTGGTWPAIWTLPTDWIYGSWPDCGEIDIMEHTGNNLGHVFGTIHTGAYNHQDGTAQSGGLMYPDVSTAFHTYTLEWYPDHLDWYYDDEIVFTFQNEYETFAEWPYDIEHHLMLNVAIGGGLGGNINANGTWPQQMMVDYVRIYDFDLGEGDEIAPTAPADLQTQVSGITVELSWTRSTDNKYVKQYYIFKDDVLIDSVSGTAYELNYLEPATEYIFSIQAEDFAGNLSEKVSVSVSTGEIQHIPIPGKFQAENFLYMDGMLTQSCADAGGGLNIAYIDPDDWMEYSVDVASTGKYFLASRAASLTTKGRFQLLDEYNIILTTVETPITGDWQNWETTVSEGFNLEEGIQRLTIKSLVHEYNLNWFAITQDSSEYAVATEPAMNVYDRIYPNPLFGDILTIELASHASDALVSIYTIDGKEVFKQEFRNGGNKLTIDNLHLEPGVYMLMIGSGDSFHTKPCLLQVFPESGI
jgi:beta-glucanase (GH16 family)